MSISVVSYFNERNQIVCTFTADSDASEKQILALAKKAIATKTDLPANLLTLKYSAGYVHILNKSVPMTRSQCDKEIERCQLRRKKSGEWLERALEESSQKTKDFKESKTKETIT
jgi:hypothetical protein